MWNQNEGFVCPIVPSTFFLHVYVLFFYNVPLRLDKPSLFISQVMIGMYAPKRLIVEQGSECINDISILKDFLNGNLLLGVFFSV